MPIFSNAEYMPLPYNQHDPKARMRWERKMRKRARKQRKVKGRPADD